MPASSADDSCINFGASYQTALITYLNSSTKTISDYKELEQLKKTADKLRSQCVKMINDDFKLALRTINQKYATISGSNSRKLNSKTLKANEIVAATILRDEQIRQVMALPNLPEKPSKLKSNKKKP
jgi:hypothetical protein